MDSLVVLELFTLAALLLCSALLTGAEAAYFSLGRARLKELAKEQGAEHNPLAPLLKQPHELLVTLLVGITVVNIAASALAASVAGKLFGSAGLAIAIGGMTFLLSVFGEVLPMTLAVEHPRIFSAWVSRPVAWLSAVIAPVRWTLGGLTALTLRVAGSERAPSEPEISEAELRTMVDVGAREGVVDRSEREMIHKVFELEDTIVREVMVPRPDMFCLDVSTSPDEVLGLLRENLHSRVPVFEDTIDQIVGVLYTKDLLPHLRGLPKDFDLRAQLHPPYFVPGSKRADALLREFQAKKLHLAIVVDEYGGTAGLVSLEDLLEELVGEIRDEFDEEERLIQKLDARTFRVSGKLSVHELNAVARLDVPQDAFDTVGGWVLDLFGRVPHKGEKTGGRERHGLGGKGRAHARRGSARDPARGGAGGGGGMIYVWLIVIAVAVTAFFSAAEMAFIGANRLRLRHLAEAGNRTAARYLESFKQPERLLSTAMMGVTLAHIIASSVATWALIPVLGNMAAVAVTLFLTPLLLVFGEVIPKAVAREWSTALILSLFQVFELASKALSPLTWATNAIVSGALRLLGRPRTSTRQFVSREELKLLLQMEPEEADVTVSEAEMIDKIFDLGDTAVREVMVPLVDVAALPDSATPDEAVRLIGERGFSRIPVFTDRAFNIVGMVTAMDLLRGGAAAADLRSLMRPATYVPETKRIDDLLREMQKARLQLAVVVDEYGGAVGIVTVEDIVEEVVGEIHDEHDRTPDTVERLPDGSYRVAGRTGIDELNEALDWELPKGDFETVAGLVLATLHRLPLVGEVLHVGRYTLTVLEADRRRILTVRITAAGATTEEKPAT